MKLSDAPPVRWGGRCRRYKEFPKATVRAYDPYSLGPISFRDDLDIAAWHQVRFTPDTKAITCKPTKVQAKVHGQLLEAEATFVAVSRGGERQYHLVCDSESEGAQLRLLTTIAERNRARVVVHLRATLRSDQRLIGRLARLRQASVIHLRDAAGVDPLILAAVRDSACSRSTLCHALPKLSAQLIDGRVANLHCAGILLMDLTRDDYGVQLRGRNHA